MSSRAKDMKKDLGKQPCGEHTKQGCEHHNTPNVDPSQNLLSPTAFSEVQISRRQFLKFGITSAILFSLPLTACENRKPYVRPKILLDLGDVRTLYYPKMFVRESHIVLYLDDKGWSALSARCSYDGCDLSYHERESYQNLFCPCCKSFFSHMGKPLEGKAEFPLPWFEISYPEPGKQSHLFADTSKIVDAEYRYSTPELLELIAKVKETKKMNIGEGIRAPKVLLGDGAPNQRGLMFKPVDPNKVYKSDMMK